MLDYKRFWAIQTLFAVGLLCIIWDASVVEATPIYAIRSANACDTCHIEPSGWANPEMADRLCSLNCTGCHVSPSGGGMRTPTGLYYGRQVLPTWGNRPGDTADPEKYRPDGHPKKGRYRLGEGFSGWWPGSLDLDDVPDRFGDIDANPSWGVGSDIRFMNFLPLDDRDPAFFPMQTDVYVMGKPLEKVTVYANVGLRGRKEDVEDQEFADYFISREMFIKAGQFRYNSYVRAGRFNPQFGWRMPNHTAYTRRDLGFGENRQVFGAEVGLSPNYLYANLAGFYQGLDGWPGDEEPKAVGSTFNIGWRQLGWQVGTSLHYLNRTEDGTSDDITGGLNWALNLYPVVYLGEVDLRLSMASEEGADDATGLFAYHELNALIAKGGTIKGGYEWQDPTTQFKDDESHRLFLGGEWHPYTHLHLEGLYRRVWAEGTHPVTDVGTSSADEALLIMHAWF